MRKPTVLMLVALTLMGCGSSVSYRLDIVFPVDGDPLQFTDSIRVSAIAPAEDAGCYDLLEGLAQVGDADYAVEAEQEFAPDSQEVKLSQVGPGRRLFFVQAIGNSGAVILHGCSDTEAGGGADETVVVMMEYVEVGQ